MCLYVTTYMSLSHLYPCFVIIYFLFCRFLVYNTTCLVSQKNVLTWKFVYSFLFIKFSDTKKIKIISWNKTKQIVKNVLIFKKF